MLKVTLDHILEIGCRLSLWLTYLYLNRLSPFVRHIEEEELWYYRYPSVSSYIPVRYLYMLMIGIPSIVFIIHFLCTRTTDVLLNIRNHFYGITLAYGITGILTAVIKLLVGRPRPNFFLRCFPDGIGTEVQNCTGEWQGQMDGRKSFPSAHSSFSFTGMLYVTCYLFEVLQLNRYRFGRAVFFCLALSPLMVAISVSLSRACDYHHHYSDILGGSMLGSAVAFLLFNHYKEFNMDIYSEFEEGLLRARLSLMQKI